MDQPKWDFDPKGKNADRHECPIYQNIPCFSLSNCCQLSSSSHHLTAGKKSPASSKDGTDTSTKQLLKKNYFSPTGQLGSDQSTSPLLALIAKANKAYAIGDFASAMRAYQQVVEVEPHNSVCHANISAILLRMNESEASRSTKEQALEAANNAILLKPDWPKAHFRRGEALAALGRNDEAMLEHAEAFRLSNGREEQFREPLFKCIELDRSISLQLDGCDEADGSVLLYTIAKCLQFAEKDELALRLYRIAAKMPSSSSADLSMIQFGLKQLACLEAARGNWTDALKVMGKQLEIAQLTGDDGTQMAIHGEMAKLLVNKLFDFDLAIQHSAEQLQIATKLSIDVPNPIRSELASLYLKSRKGEQAKEAFRQILAAQPRDPAALLGLGQAFYLMNDLQSALTLFNRVEQLTLFFADDAKQGTFWTDAVVGKCHCYLARDEPEKAIHVSENVLMMKNATKSAAVNFGRRAKFQLVMALGQMKMGKLPEAMRWAKRTLTAQINEGKSGETMVEELYTVMALYAQMGQWENAGKLAAKLVNQLEKCPFQPNPFGPSPGCILEKICQIQCQSSRGAEQIRRRTMALRMKMVPDFGDEWAKIAMEMAKMSLGQQEHCWDTRVSCCDERLVQRLDSWTTKCLEPMDMELNPDQARVQWEVDLLAVKAELAWTKIGKKNVEEVDENDDDDDVNQCPFTLLETALMLAQEGALADAEADICLRLGEWHFTENEQNEANVYLRQVISLERQMVPVNQGRLLRAYSTLIKVLCAQCQWEDAFSAARFKLGIEKSMAMPMADRLRTQLIMGQILLETTTNESSADDDGGGHLQCSANSSNNSEQGDDDGTSSSHHSHQPGTTDGIASGGTCFDQPTFCPQCPSHHSSTIHAAMQIFRRIHRRAKHLNATAECQLAEEYLAQCRYQSRRSTKSGTKENKRSPPPPRPKGWPMGRDNNNNDDDDSSAPTNNAQFRDEDTEMYYCCIRGESGAESATSGGAQVIGVDFADD